MSRSKRNSSRGDDERVNQLMAKNARPDTCVEPQTPHGLTLHNDAMTPATESDPSCPTIPVSKTCC